MTQSGSSNFEQSENVYQTATKQWPTIFVVVYKTRSFLDKSCLSPMGLRCWIGICSKYLRKVENSSTKVSEVFLANFTSDDCRLSAISSYLESSNWTLFAPDPVCAPSASLAHYGQILDRLLAH